MRPFGRDDELIGGEHQLGARLVLHLRLRGVDQPAAALVLEIRPLRPGVEREHHVLRLDRRDERHALASPRASISKCPGVHSVPRNS